jgi:two-component system, OmpR family, phosphate regulon response regulator PhoB
MKPTILVVEDEPAILELLAVHLADAGYDVREAPDAESAQCSVNEVLPDLVLLDWMLPGQSGLALARQLRRDARTRELPIIMVTARAEEADKVAGLEAWVDDYVTKPFSPRELKARIKAVLRRRAPEAVQETLRSGALMLDPLAHRVVAFGNEVPLGATEFRLLRFLMARPDRVHSRSQLLDGVWGDHVYIEERTVDVHVRRLRAALEPFNADAMIETVRGSGYRFVASAARATLSPGEASRPE